MSDDEIVREFLVESHENLDRLDQELILLEKDPANAQILAGIFRTIHTIKGTCGFLGFSKLEAIAHAGENLLSKLREGKMAFTPESATILLATVDAIRQILASIESSGEEGARDDRELIARLGQMIKQETAPPPSNPADEALPTLGDLLIQHAGVKYEDVKKAVKKQSQGDPRRLGEILVQEGVARPDDVAKALQAQQKAREKLSVADSTIRVDVNLLDSLMTLVGELVLTRNQIVQYTGSTTHSALIAASQRLNLLTSELQAGVMKTRMQPISNVGSKFPRIVRDLALTCGKEAVIEMEGQDTELDKTILESIKDPLTHLVRNALDHGIEKPEERRAAGKNPTGRLHLRAFHHGGQVIIEFMDDGAGLDAARIRRKALERSLITAEQAARMADREINNLIFLPGFSTAEKVTNVSGRGVGMDVVKTSIEGIGGTVDIESHPGHGSTVTMKIPLTLAIIPALMVTCGGERFAIPQVSLLELVRLEPEEVETGIEMVHGAPVYRLRGQLLPLVFLRRELGMPVSTGRIAEEVHAIHIVVLQSDGRAFGLVVDEVNDTEEIVVKPLCKQLKSIKTFAGASIMGDGRVALILDVAGVAQRSGVISGSRHQRLPESAADTAGQKAAKQAFLLFSGHDDARMALPLCSLSRLEEFPAALMERSGEQWVVQYGGKILPVLPVDSLLEERRTQARHPRRDDKFSGDVRLPVLVCKHEGRDFGLVVEAILDIVEDAAEVRLPPSRAGVRYSAVIHGRVTEVIDIPAMLQTSGMWQGAAMEHTEVIS
ncbi:MAG: chemotaxis protein CheW [Candidatus Acidiferrales bacterium]